MGEYEARTQGVPVAVSYRDNRGRSIVPPSAAVRHSFHFETGSKKGDLLARRLALCKPPGEWQFGRRSGALT